MKNEPEKFFRICLHNFVVLSVSNGFDLMHIGVCFESKATTIYLMLSKCAYF